MAKVLLVLKVFLLLFTSEVLSVSVAETLFIALSEKIHESLQKINARLDKIENVIEMNGYSKDTGNDVKDDMGKQKDIYSEIMKVNQRFKKAITSEKRHVRELVKGFEEQFHELKTDVKHIISGFNKTMKDSKDNMVGKIELKTVNDRVTIMENNQNDQEHTIKKLESTMTSSNSQRESEISSLDNRVTTWQNAQNSTIKELEGRMTSINNQRESDISSLTSRVTTLRDKQAGFHVSMSSKKEFVNGSTLIFDNVIYNPESAYSASSGRFTAPYTGTYLFSMTLLASGNEKAYVMFKSKDVSKMYTYANKGEYVTTSSTCVTFMNEGEEAWIESNGNCEFWNGLTQFTGVFLY